MLRKTALPTTRSFSAWATCRAGIRSTTVRPAVSTRFRQLVFSGQTSPSSLTWNLQYGGPYDLANTGWTRPTLTGALTAARPAQRISAQATLALPGSQQKDAFYVQSASLSGDWQFGRRVALSGLASYTRAPVYGPNQPLNETLSLQPLAFNFTFGQQ